jgi:hypothetical protein
MTSETGGEAAGHMRHNPGDNQRCAVRELADTVRDMPSVMTSAQAKIDQAIGALEH